MRKGELNIQHIVWVATTIFICLTIWFGMFLYRTTEEEMADQFNSQQIILAQETATGIEEYLGSLRRSLRLAGAMSGWLGKGDVDLRDRFYHSFQDPVVIDVWQLNSQGVMDSSLIKLADTYSHTLAEKFWQELSQMEVGEIRTSGIFRHKHSSPSATNITKAIILATKLPPPVSSAVNEQDDPPQVLAFVISLEKIISKFISPIKSGQTGYAWLLDENGVLLHHPEHPEMIDRSIFKVSHECYQCHVSYDMERKMVQEKRAGQARYMAATRKDKLIAYSPISIGQRTWTIAVSAPYTEVTQLVRKSFYHILFFSLVVISGLLGVNVFIFRINKERMQAESRALYADKLEREVQERTQQIQQEKQKLDDIVSAIGAELSVIDQDFRILWANEKVIQRFGSLESITATHCYKTYYGREDICPQCPAIKTFQQEQVEQNELRLNNQGHTRYYQITTTPISNYTGEVVQVLVLTQDITTQKQQEQILIDSERMSAVGQIAAGLAHDLGNPLTIIAGSAQFGLQNLKPPARIKESLQVINRNASAANKVINALLRFARPSGNAVFIPIDLKDLVQKTLLLLKSELAKKKIKVKQEYPSEALSILGDKSQLEQVLVNIILNSIEALSQGGEIHIIVESDSTANMVNLYITDDGPGILKEHLDSIFDPFFTTRVRGVGLGLSISKRIIEHHQGKIMADNSPQGGAQIKISLPLHQLGAKRRRIK